MAHGKRDRSQRGRPRRAPRGVSMAPGGEASFARLMYPSNCEGCGLAMPAGTQYVTRKGRPIHPSCAPGADD